MDYLLREASDLPRGLSWARSRRYNWEGESGLLSATPGSGT